jgi:hypothetical protein
MPIHDWTRVPAGTWHDFHVGWVAPLARGLNAGLLPNGYHALAEPQPDRAEDTATDEPAVYALKRRTIAIRRDHDDGLVALIEIVSPGNKSARRALETFVEKAVESLYRVYHLLVIDLFPPGPRDPNGIHAAIWGEISDEPFALPADEPLTLAAYSAGDRKIGYIEPTAVGRALIDMPLFLTPDEYVNVPLEATYLAAYRGVARRRREVLEAPPG